MLRSKRVRVPLGEASIGGLPNRGDQYPLMIHFDGDEASGSFAGKIETVRTVTETVVVQWQDGGKTSFPLKEFIESNPGIDDPRLFAQLCDQPNQPNRRRETKKLKPDRRSKENNFYDDGDESDDESDNISYNGGSKCLPEFQSNPPLEPVVDLDGVGQFSILDLEGTAERPLIDPGRCRDLTALFEKGARTICRNAYRERALKMKVFRSRTFPVGAAKQQGIPTLLRPALQEIQAIFFEVAPGFTYNYLCVNLVEDRRESCKKHVDKGNEPGTGSLIMAFGDFEGGGLNINGVSFDVRNRPMTFPGATAEHFVTGHHGDRWSVIAFTASAKEAARLKLVEKRQRKLHLDDGNDDDDCSDSAANNDDSGNEGLSALTTEELQAKCAHSFEVCGTVFRSAVVMPRRVQMLALEAYSRCLELGASYGGGKPSTSSVPSSLLGHIIMPCGAGKSLVSLWLAEMTMLRTSSAGPRRIVIVFPSLQLVHQTLDTHLANRAVAWRPQVVCSSAEGTTNPTEIASFLSEDMSCAHRIVYTTLMSLPLVFEACRIADKSFDLLIGDEGHHVRGKGRNGATLFEENKRFCQRRLLVTATPDPDMWRRCGDCLLDVTLPQAVSEGVVLPYRIVIAPAPWGYLPVVCGAGRGIHSSATRLVTRDAACVTAVAKAIAALELQEGVVFRNVLTFHTVNMNARSFAAAAGVAGSGLGHFNVLALPGGADAAAVDAAVECAATGQRKIVASCRKLLEGVDKPCVDLVVFVDPKLSAKDCIQGVGRAQRPFTYPHQEEAGCTGVSTAANKSKTHAYVIILSDKYEPGTTGQAARDFGKPLEQAEDTLKLREDSSGVDVDIGDGDKKDGNDEKNGEKKDDEEDDDDEDEDNGEEQSEEEDDDDEDNPVLTEDNAEKANDYTDEASFQSNDYYYDDDESDDGKSTHDEDRRTSDASADLRKRVLDGGEHDDEDDGEDPAEEAREAEGEGDDAALRPSSTEITLLSALMRRDPDLMRCIEGIAAASSSAGREERDVDDGSDAEGAAAVVCAGGSPRCSSSVDLGAMAARFPYFFDTVRCLHEPGSPPAAAFWGDMFGACRDAVAFRDAEDDRMLFRPDLATTAQNPGPKTLLTRLIAGPGTRQAWADSCDSLRVFFHNHPDFQPGCCSGCASRSRMGHGAPCTKRAGEPDCEPRLQRWYTEQRKVASSTKGLPDDRRRELEALRIDDTRGFQWTLMKGRTSESRQREAKPDPRAASIQDQLKQLRGIFAAARSTK